MLSLVSLLLFSNAFAHVNNITAYEGDNCNQIPIAINKSETYSICDPKSTRKSFLICLRSPPLEPTCMSTRVEKLIELHYYSTMIPDPIYQQEDPVYYEELIWNRIFDFIENDGYIDPGYFLVLEHMLNSRLKLTKFFNLEDISIFDKIKQDLEKLSDLKLKSREKMNVDDANRLWESYKDDNVFTKTRVRFSKFDQVARIPEDPSKLVELIPFDDPVQDTAEIPVDDSKKTRKSSSRLFKSFGKLVGSENFKREFHEAYSKFID